MLWSIDTCQNNVSAEQYHVTILRSQDENSSSFFFKLTTEQVVVFKQAIPSELTIIVNS